jgi:Vacuolar protein sorting-associated protein 62
MLIMWKYYLCSVVLLVNTVTCLSTFQHSNISSFDEHEDRQTQGVTSSRYAELARKHAPVVHFHPKEIFFPSSVDYFFGLTYNKSNPTESGDKRMNYETIFKYPDEEWGSMWELCPSNTIPKVEYLLRKGLGGQNPEQVSVPVM